MDILVKYAKIQIDTEKNNELEGGRRFLRFHFKNISSEKFDFDRINLKFKSHLENFGKKPFKFQLYMLNFSGLSSLKGFEQR